jgi:Uma2 family endonuclease
MNAFSAREERESYITRPRLTVDEFHRMGEAGVLPQGARVERYEGELIGMPSIGPAHASAVDRLVALLSPSTSAAVLRVQNRIAIAERSEPIPDLVALRERPGNSPFAHPRPVDVPLSIEVSDTTLRHDRDDKMRL